MTKPLIPLTACAECKHEASMHDEMGLCWVNWRNAPSGFRTPSSRRPCSCVEYRKPSALRRAWRRFQHARQGAQA